MATLNLRPTLIGRRPAAASTRLSIEDIASGWRPGQSFFTPINYSRGALSTAPTSGRSEEHTSELQSLMRISYAVFCLKKKITHIIIMDQQHTNTNIQHIILQ